LQPSSDDAEIGELRLTRQALGILPQQSQRARTDSAINPPDQLILESLTRFEGLVPGQFDGKSSNRNIMGVIGWFDVPVSHDRVEP
jgi:hypothetical protein